MKIYVQENPIQWLQSISSDMEYVEESTRIFDSGSSVYIHSSVATYNSASEKTELYSRKYLLHVTSSSKDIDPNFPGEQVVDGQWYMLIHTEVIFYCCLGT